MKNLVIGGGHGGSDVGCIAVDKSYEKTYTLELSKKVYDICKPYVNTTMLRTTDKDLSLGERCRIANSKAPCYYFSFHFNAFNNSAKGIEIYTSQFTSQTNKDFASYLCKEFSKQFGTSNRGGKVKSGNNGDYYYLHRNTNSNVTTFIIEPLFIDNKYDFEILKSPNFIDKAANFFASKILSNLYGINMSKADNNKKLYRIQVGAFSDKKNAEDIAGKLKELGFESIITED